MKSVLYTFGILAGVCLVLATISEIIGAEINHKGLKQLCVFLLIFAVVCGIFCCVTAADIESIEKKKIKGNNPNGDENE